ncbi:MAG: HAMP domain-containing histidine kinase [Clostridiales bacterium]|jgi:signal transduction histidine kinase|nr:HAMP domain-containing histidine kinase [Clostridiales bacterium]
MPKNEKGIRFWDRLRLRGRLLTLMLTVALTALLICVVSFVVMNNRMLDSAHEDARILSDNVQFMTSMLMYQQANLQLLTESFTAGIYLDARLTELRAKGESPDWDMLVKETYDFMNAWGQYEPDETALFILTDDDLYVYGTAKETFVEKTEELRRVEWFEYEYTTFENCVLDSRDSNGLMVYSEEEGGGMYAWRIFDRESKYVGMVTPNADAMFLSDRLRELMDTETEKAVGSMAATAWRSLFIFIIVIAALLVILPLASRRLAMLVVNPVEREQERQRGLLLAAEEEKRQIEEIDKLKTEFFQNMHHDMKTPLNVINTDIQYADIMLDSDIDKSVVQKKLESAQHEIIRLARMVENSLDIAAAQINQKYMEQFGFAALLREKSEVFRSIMKNNGNTLSINIPDNLPDITGNADMLSQVIFNLMYNAHKHTQNGEIIVSLEQTGGVLAAAIRDTGEGIGLDLLPRVFERGASSDGTGYGLAICKTIIVMHGGDINIESSLGKGTVVTFTLPLELAGGDV